MVIMRVRNQNCVRTEAPYAAEPVLAAIDQHSTAGTADHDGGMHPMETRPRLNVPPRPEECQTHDLTLCSFAFGQRSASHGSALMNAGSCRDGVSRSRDVDNIGPASGPSENLCGHEGIHQCIADERVQSPQLLHLLFVQAQTRHLLVLAADTLKPLRHG